MKFKLKLPTVSRQKIKSILGKIISYRRPLLFETITLAIVALVIFSAHFHLFGKNQPPSQNPVQTQETAPTIVPAKEEDYLIIDKLDIKVPIVFDVDGKNKTAYNNSLKSGVAHMKDTAKPGEEGNSFIFGHSSYYSGEYRKVFAKLNDLEADDDILITVAKKEYKYKVTKKKVVAANDMSVTKQPKGKKILTLMTCWPIGTTEKRLVVTANLIE